MLFFPVETQSKCLPDTVSPSHSGRYRRPASNLFAQEIWYEVVSHLPLQKSRAPLSKQSGRWKGERDAGRDEFGDVGWNLDAVEVLLLLPPPIK